jgi:hypothetical protein
LTQPDACTGRKLSHARASIPAQKLGRLPLTDATTPWLRRRSTTLRRPRAAPRVAGAGLPPRHRRRYCANFLRRPGQASTSCSACCRRRPPSSPPAVLLRQLPPAPWPGVHEPLCALQAHAFLLAIGGATAPTSSGAPATSTTSCRSPSQRLSSTSSSTTRSSWRRHGRCPKKTAS